MIKKNKTSIFKYKKQENKYFFVFLQLLTIQSSAGHPKDEPPTNCGTSEDFALNVGIP